VGKQKRKAVRVFEHALRLLAKCNTDMSSKTSGKSEQNLQNYDHRLRKLAEEDPENEFWSTLQRANLKMIRYLRDLVR